MPSYCRRSLALITYYHFRGIQRTSRQWWYRQDYQSRLLTPCISFVQPCHRESSFHWSRNSEPTQSLPNLSGHFLSNRCYFWGLYRKPPREAPVQLFQDNILTS